MISSVNWRKSHKEKYTGLVKWLQVYDVTGADIKESTPDLFNELIAAIEEMDSRMNNEDIEDFTGPMGRVKRLYLAAVSKS